jgi:RND family efflux transporter MFP subunit
VSNQFKRAVKPLLILVVGGVVIFALITMKPKPEPQPSPVTVLLDVTVVAIETKTKRVEVLSQGTVMPRREVDLVSQVSGNVVFVAEDFVDGGFVSPNSVLVQIDKRDYQLALIRSEASVAEAEQKLAFEKGRSRQAKREWKELGDKDANELFLRKPQLKATEAQLLSAQADRDQAKLNLERTLLSIPFAGRIRETMVNLGQYVSKGSPIARVYDSAIVEIRLPLTDRQLALVNIPVQQSTLKSFPEVEIRATLAGRDLVWPGHIVRSDASVDTQSRFYYVVAEVDNNALNGSGENSLPPLMVGLFVESKIAGRELLNVLELPKNAVFNRNRLFTVDANNVIHEHVINVVQMSGDSVWVQGDFMAGEQVVLDKQILLSAGMVVTPSSTAVVKN